MAESELPIGRRVAQWRVRRGMSQQVFADRIGKSKSWVDKVERGVRSLDRFSVIEDVAGVLRVDPVVLLGRDALPPAVAADVQGVEGIRAALALHHMDGVSTGARPAPSPAELRRSVQHAWLSYQHARYPQLLRMLPELLAVARRTRAQCGGPAAELLVQVYRVTSSVLVKLGEPDLAWLAADRAMAAAEPDPLLTAAAAVSLGQALRALGRGRLAITVTITTAHRIAPALAPDTPGEESSLLGALLLQAALAAAGCGDERSVHELLDQAAKLAEQVGDGPDHQWTNFGPTAVELARITAAVDLGDAGDAVVRHGKVTGREQWRRLPAEHRAAHLLDVARAYLQLGDLAGAGRVVVAADQAAPAETRSRPAARTVLAELVRGGPVPAGMAHLVAALGLG